MAATTPYQANDYQAVSNYRPYELPINDIFKSLQAKNQIWDAGAARVKSVYDNALNLKLSLEPNKEIRRKFMEEAEKQLNRLSSMDLSKPDVQRQGFDIFKPLFQDQGVMSDDQATRWIDSIQSDIQRSIDSDNGKGYADSNAAVAMEGVYEFKNSQDRMAGMKYLSNKRSYIPYYDPSKEVMDILKNCKGPSSSSTVPGAQGEMYLHTQEVSGASSARIQSCLSAGLSQRAKDQLGIDGYASYMTNNRIDHPEGKNYNALRDDYMATFGASLDSITQDLGDIEGKILAYSSAYNQTKDPKYLEMKKAAEKMRGEYSDQIKNLNDSYTQISSGNLEFIKKNYGPLSEQIYTRKKLGLFGEAFRNDRTEDKYSADAVRLQQQRLLYDQAKQKAQFQHDIDMENLQYENDIQKEIFKSKLKNEGGSSEELVPTSPSYTEDNKVTSGYSDFVKERDNTLKAVDSVNGELFNTLKRKYPKEMESYTNAVTFFTPGPNGVSPALSFLDTHSRIADDPAVQQWSSESALLTNKLALLKGYEESSELEVKTAMPEAFDRRKVLKGVSPITLSDGTIVTPDQVVDAIEGKPSPVEFPRYESMGPYRTNVIGSYKVNGKIYKTEGGEQDYNLRSFIQDILTKNFKNSTKINEKRNEIYGRAMLTIRPDVYADANNIDKNDPTRNNILASLPQQFDIKDIQIMSKDASTGLATISIKGNDKVSISSKDVKERLSRITYVDEVIGIDEGKNEALVRVRSPHLVDKRTLSNPMTMLQLNLEKIALSVQNPLSPYAKKQPGELIMSLPITTQTYKGNDFQVDVIKTSTGVKYEVLVKLKNNLTSQDGNVTKKKGEYAETGQVFTNINQLLGHLNSSQ